METDMTAERGAACATEEKSREAKECSHKRNQKEATRCAAPRAVAIFQRDAQRLLQLHFCALCQIENVEKHRSTTSWRHINPQCASANLHPLNPRSRTFRRTAASIWLPETLFWSTHCGVTHTRKRKAGYGESSRRCRDTNFVTATIIKYSQT